MRLPQVLDAVDVVMVVFIRWHPWLWLAGVGAFFNSVLLLQLLLRWGSLAASCHRGPLSSRGHFWKKTLKAFNCGIWYLVLLGLLAI